VQAYLGRIDQGLAALQVLAVVVIHHVKGSLREGGVVGGGAKLDLEAGEGAVLVEGGLGGELGLVAVVEDGDVVALADQLLGQVVADEGVAAALSVGEGLVGEGWVLQSVRSATKAAGVSQCARNRATVSNSGRMDARMLLKRNDVSNMTPFRA